MRQALASRDEQIFNKVFSKKDTAVISATVDELSGTEAFDLLQSATVKLHKYPMLGTELSFWMKQILISHATYFMSNPAMQNALQPLYETLKQRCATAQSFNALHSRLLPVLIQHKDKAEVADVQEPLVQYEEGDEDITIEEGDSEDEEEEGLRKNNLNDNFS